MSDSTTRNGEGTMDCARVMREEITEQYLSRQLNEADRDAFEAHFFECLRCFDEVQAYQSIRRALEASAQPEAIPPVRSRHLRRWIWAAAAAVVVLSVAIWRLKPATPSLTELAAISAPTYQPAETPGAADPAMRQFNDAMAKYLRGDYAGTIAGLQQFAETEARWPEVHLYLGVSYLLNGDSIRAIRPLQAAFRIGESPYQDDAKFFLAKALLSQGDVVRARLELENTIALHGDRESEAKSLITTLDRFFARPATDKSLNREHRWPAEGSALDVAGFAAASVRGSVYYVPGVVGKAFAFDGTGGVSIQDRSALSLVDAGSVSFWLFLESADTDKAILYKGTDYTNDPSYGWSTYQNLLRFDLYSGDLTSPGYVNLFMPLIEVVGRWTHLVATWDGTTVKVYKDGRLNRDVAGRTSVSYAHFKRVETPRDLFFSGDQRQDRFCKCKLDEVQILPRAMSATEVSMMFGRDRSVLLLTETNDVLLSNGLGLEDRTRVTEALRMAQQSLASGRLEQAAIDLRRLIGDLTKLKQEGRVAARDTDLLVRSAQAIIAAIEK